MTGIPTPNSNQFNVRYLSVMEQNHRSATELRNSFVDYANIFEKGIAAFNGADNLQVKSLAIGTSLNKLLKVNNDALDKMYGSYFENAEELLKNYSEGLTQNVDGMNTLNNRMRLTGQSTDVLRKAMGSVATLTGDSNKSLERLSKSNIELSEKYGTSNESIVAAIESIKKVSEVPSFLGLGEGVADLAQSLKAVSKDRGAELVPQAIEMLIGSNFQNQRAMLGIQDSSDRLLDTNLTTAERLDLAVNYMNIAQSKLNDIAKYSGDTNKVVIQDAILNGLGNKDQLVAFNQFTNLVNEQLKLGNIMRDENASYLDSARTLEESALAYYEYTMGTVYPWIMKALPAVIGATVGTSLARSGVARYATILGPSVTRLATGLLRFAGPIGIAASFIPDIIGLFTDNTATEKERLKIEKDKVIAENTKKQKDERGSTEGFIAQFSRDILSKKESSKQEMEEYKKQTQLLAQIAGFMETQRENLIPSTGRSYQTGGR